MIITFSAEGADSQRRVDMLDRLHTTMAMLVVVATFAAVSGAELGAGTDGGRTLFDRQWTIASSAGPEVNAFSCSACHDGRKVAAAVASHDRLYSSPQPLPTQPAATCSGDCDLTGSVPSPRFRRRVTL